MFANRAFSIAFVISLAWHFFCMSMFNIVVLPGKYRARDLSSVSFLGPLLEKTALEIMLVNKPVAIDTRYRRDLKYKHALGEEDILRAVGKGGDETKNYIRTRLEETMEATPRMPFSLNKEKPQAVSVKAPQSISVKDSGSLSGNVAGREVIYKPVMPSLPRWLAAGAPFTLELEFSVSAQGEIKRVTPIVSSGNSEVDLLGTRHLKAWKFAPLSPGLSEEQEGRIKLTFGAK